MTKLWGNQVVRVSRKRGSNPAMVGSMVLHGVVGFLVFLPSDAPPVLPPTYKVELVAAPRPPPRPQRRRPEVEQRPAEVGIVAGETQHDG